MALFEDFIYNFLDAFDDQGERQRMGRLVAHILESMAIRPDVFFDMNDEVTPRDIGDRIMMTWGESFHMSSAEPIPLRPHQGLQIVRETLRNQAATAAERRAAQPLMSAQEDQIGLNLFAASPTPMPTSSSSLPPTQLDNPSTSSIMSPTPFHQSNTFDGNVPTVVCDTPTHAQPSTVPRTPGRNIDFGSEFPGLNDARWDQFFPISSSVHRKSQNPARVSKTENLASLYAAMVDTDDDFAKDPTYCPTSDESEPEQDSAEENKSEAEAQRSPLRERRLSLTNSSSSSTSESSLCGRTSRSPIRRRNSRTTSTSSSSSCSSSCSCILAVSPITANGEPTKPSTNDRNKLPRKRFRKVISSSSEDLSPKPSTSAARSPLLCQASHASHSPTVSQERSPITRRNETSDSSSDTDSDNQPREDTAKPDKGATIVNTSRADKMKAQNVRLINQIPNYFGRKCPHPDCKDKPTFGYSKNYRRHYVEQHLANKVYICKYKLGVSGKICGAMSSCQQTHEAHVLTHSNRPFICVICNLQFSSQQALCNHRTRKH